jgi:hypothetical protein
METTLRIHTDLLSNSLIENIQKMFPHKEVEISIQEADATEFILSNAAYTKELESRINEYQQKKEVIKLKLDELL